MFSQLAPLLKQAEILKMEWLNISWGNTYMVTVAGQRTSLVVIQVSCNFSRSILDEPLQKILASPGFSEMEKLSTKS